MPKSWRNDAVAPLASDEARVRPVWEYLAARSCELGLPIPKTAFTEDPGLYLQVDGRAIAPVVAERHRCVFVLPRCADAARLISRSSYPTDERPWLDEMRRLGVHGSRLVWHGPDGTHDPPVDHPTIGDGWWDIERDGCLLRRWTNGDGLLPRPAEAFMLEVHLAGGIRYRLDAPERGEQRQRIAA